MTEYSGGWGQDKAIRVTWYVVGVAAIIISVIVSIYEILR